MNDDLQNQLQLRFLSCVAVLGSTILLAQFHSTNCARGGGGGGGGGGAGSGGAGGVGRSRYYTPGLDSNSNGPGNSQQGSGSISASYTGSLDPVPARGQVNAPRGYFGNGWPSAVNTRWGKSAAVGSSSRVDTGRSRAAAKTQFQAVGDSAIRSSVNRPIANPPPPSSRIPVELVFNTHTTSDPRGSIESGRLLLTGPRGSIGGYLLGSILTRTVYQSQGCCYGCDCPYRGKAPPWYYDTYLPFRYRYGLNGSVAASETKDFNGTTRKKPLQKFAMCTLARWNLELPFTELPNMALAFLANDNISGTTIENKTRFLYELLRTAVRTYGRVNTTHDTFIISDQQDLVICNFKFRKRLNRAFDHEQPNNTTSTSLVSTTATTTTTTPNDGTGRPFYAGAVLAQWTDMVRKGDRTICNAVKFAHIPECANPVFYEEAPIEEPIFTGIRFLAKLYTNISVDPQMAADLIASAQRCFPSVKKKGAQPQQMLPCLDYSISSRQVLALDSVNETQSVFGNNEMCKKYFNLNISNCSPEGSTFACTFTDLITLNVFARNYYLCDEAVDLDLVKAINSTFTPDNTNSTTTTAIRSSATSTPSSTTGTALEINTPELRNILCSLFLTFFMALAL